MATFNKEQIIEGEKLVKLLIADGKGERLLLATNILEKRIIELREKRAQNPTVQNPNLSLIYLENDARQRLMEKMNFPSRDKGMNQNASGGEVDRMVLATQLLDERLKEIQNMRIHYTPHFSSEAENG